MFYNITLITIILIILIILLILLFYNKKQIKHKNLPENLHIFLVSLPKDRKRRNQLDFIPDKIVGINGANLDIEQMKKNNIINENTNLKKGEIGCYLSHLFLIKDIYKNKNLYNNNILIIEDDAKISNNKIYDIVNTINNVNHNFDIIFLGYNYFENKENETTDKNTINISKVHGTHSYIINPRNITEEKISKLDKIDIPIDIKLCEVFDSYIITPKKVNLNTKFSNYSNTQSIN
jgi:GR25 family glycosyltransferase involved in LPS biosynthesis